MQNGEKFNVKECVRLTSIACTSDQQVGAENYPGTDTNYHLSGSGELS